MFAYQKSSQSTLKARTLGIYNLYQTGGNLFPLNYITISICQCFWGQSMLDFQVHTHPQRKHENKHCKGKLSKERGSAGLWAATFRYQVLWVSGREISKGRSTPKSERFAGKSESFNRIPPQFCWKNDFASLWDVSICNFIGWNNRNHAWEWICLVIHIDKTHSAHEPMQRRKVSVLFCL